MVGALKVFWIYFRVSALAEMQYRVNFFLSLFQAAISLVAGLVTLGLVFGQVPALNGWTKPEMLVVLGTFTIVGGVVRMVMKPNVNRFLREVEDGTLDFLFTRPMDAQLTAASRDFALWQGTDIGVGFVVLGIAVSELPGGVTACGVLGFALGILLALVMIYGFLSILCCFAFWFTRVHQIVDIFDGVFAAGRWPVGIYPSWLRMGLSAVVPIGLAITVPAASLTSKLSGALLLAGVVAAIAVVVVARIVWRVGVRKYSGASS